METGLAKIVRDAERFEGRRPLATGKAAIVASQASIILLFVGNETMANWNALRLALAPFDSMIDVMTVGRISDLDLIDVEDVDIIFILDSARPREDETRDAKKSYPSASLIHMTASRRRSSERSVIQLLPSGAIPMECISHAVMKAMHRKICLLQSALHAPRNRGKLLPNLSSRLGLLTRRQMEILVVVLKGRPNKLVARELDISVRTVKAHLTEIFRKTGIVRRAELIAEFGQSLPGQESLSAEQSTGRMVRDAHIGLSCRQARGQNSTSSYGTRLDLSPPVRAYTLASTGRLRLASR